MPLRLPFSSLLILWCIVLYAAPRDVRISGDVSDVLTRQGVVRAAVSLLTADSTSLLATDTTSYVLMTNRVESFHNSYRDRYSGAAFTMTAPAQAQYRLVVKAEGYEDYSTEIEAPAGKEQIRVEPIYLTPVRDRKLGEVVVRATRIKMYYNGDTLVYNADAFDVARTESLRRLVSQLPGAEITDGEIRVNGKRIENLLISGKNFFEGNIQSALDNLPAYIVSRIKVYDKAGEKSELTGRDMLDGNYVMDVHLKRKYVGTWTAKISADGGTERLWGGQAFLMRIDDRQMFSVNGDINNFNQTREMMGMSNAFSSTPAGKIRSKLARFNYYFEPDEIWRLSADGKVVDTDTKRKTWTNTETYLEPVNMMKRDGSDFDGDDFKATATIGVRARKVKHWLHQLTYGLNYARTKGATDKRSISYYLPGNAAWDDLTLDSINHLEEKEGEANLLLYSMVESEMSRSQTFNHHPAWRSSFVFGADVVYLYASMRRETMTQRSYSDYLLTTYADGSTDPRRRYKDFHNRLLNIDGRLQWSHQYERVNRFSGVVEPYIQFIHSYGSASHPEYRLDRLTQWADRQDWGLGSLGLLPSAEWQSICLDEANSYFSTDRNDMAQAGVDWRHKWMLREASSLEIEANEMLYWQRRSLDYERESRLYHPLRKGLFFRPYLKIKWKSDKREGRTLLPELTVGYIGNPSMPSLMQLLPIRDNSDPLNRFVGNDDLRNSFTHEINSSYRLQNIKWSRSLAINVIYRRLINDVATLSVYDPETGVRTYQPVNTSHTQNLNGRLEITSPLDRRQRFFLTASFAVDYRQSENLSFLASGSEAAAGLLRNTGITPGLTFRAVISGKFNFSGQWNTVFRHVSQPGIREDYRQTRLYGNLSYNLPWGIRLATYIQTIFYDGNNQAALNLSTTNWDASLTKYFLDDRLGLTLTCHDILAQSSIYSLNVTSTGRAESYTDKLPRYLLLTLSYNFNWTEKK